MIDIPVSQSTFSSYDELPKKEDPKSSLFDGIFSTIFQYTQSFYQRLVKISQNQPLGGQSESATHHDHLESATWRFHF